MLKQTTVQGIAFFGVIVCIGCSNTVPPTSSLNESEEKTEIVVIDETATHPMVLGADLTMPVMYSPSLLKNVTPSLHNNVSDDQNQMLTLNKTAKTLSETMVYSHNFRGQQEKYVLGWNGSWVDVYRSEVGDYVYYGDGGTTNSGMISIYAPTDWTPLKNTLVACQIYTKSSSSVTGAVIARSTGGSYLNRIFYMAELGSQKLTIWRVCWGTNRYYYFRLAEAPCAYSAEAWYHLHFYLNNTYLETCLYTEAGTFITGAGVYDDVITGAGYSGLRASIQAKSFVRQYDIYRLN